MELELNSVPFKEELLQPWTVLTNLGEIALAELGHGVEKSFLDVLKLRVVLGLQLGDLAHDLGERLPPEAAVLCVDLEAFVYK